jgi:hypothetical protein
LKRTVKAGSPWTAASEDALKTAEYAAQTAARFDDAGLKATVREVESPFTAAEPAKKLETAAVSREDAIKSFEGTDAARARFEKALTRIDEARGRKVEAALRAESVKAEPLAFRNSRNLIVRTVKPEADHIASIQEFSDGRRVITERTEYPISSKTITESPDGTRTTAWRRSTSGDTLLSYVDETKIEHPNGKLERRSMESVKDQSDINFGSIEHVDGSVERWYDDTVDFSKFIHIENKKGVVTSHIEADDY